MRRAGGRGGLLLALILGGAAPGVAQQAPIVRGAGPLPAGASALRLEGTPMQGALVRGHARPGTRLTLDGHDVPVAADGTFVLGFDRDAPATMRVAEHFTGPAGTPLVVTTALTVAPRAWRIERLNTLPRFPAPDPVRNDAGRERPDRCPDREEREHAPDLRQGHISVLDPERREERDE